MIFCFHFIFSIGYDKQETKKQRLWLKISKEMDRASSVARGGLEPPHWPVKYAKSNVFGDFQVDFC